MIALIRIVTIFFYFLLINLMLLVICISRPFHRDNVHMAGILYSSISKLLGLKLELRIPERVKNGGPFVFIANHQNSYDLLTICAAAQKGTVIIGKKSLVWIPVFGQIFWLLGNIIIDRKNSGRAHDTLQSTAKKIKDRRISVWFFPEGTRSCGRGLLPFKSGAFRIAKATNEAVVTVCASSLFNKVKLNRWDNGTLIIEASEPQMMDDSKSIREWSDCFHQKMTQQIQNLNFELEQRAV
ncbi:MAG: 1-acyl-sn-glycerol-3-phosphate acyltransferase [Paraglaciecola sp.]